MLWKQNIKTLAAILVCITVVNGQQNKRQIGKSGAGIINTDEDRDTAETSFGASIGGHGKYFQYAHVPQKDHYEFGHRKGNEHHFKERHEKAHPHAGEFKTKVRWGDKHGGYGEHYWDYNHAGHHDGDGEESQAVEEYESYEPSASSKQTQTVKSQPIETRDYARGKRHEQAELNDMMKFVYDSDLRILTDEVSGKSFKLEPLN